MAPYGRHKLDTGEQNSRPKQGRGVDGIPFVGIPIITYDTNNWNNNSYVWHEEITQIFLKNKQIQYKPGKYLNAKYDKRNGAADFLFICWESSAIG